MVRGHVKKLIFHKFRKGEMRKQWEKMIRKGLDKAKFTFSNNSVVCSNHFEYGKPTSGFPFPKLFS